MTGPDNTLGVQDWINPIAMKEMRQAVKGRTIIWALVFFLIIQLVIIGAVLVFSEDVQKDFSIGRSIFSGLLGVLMAVCLLLLPAYTGLRVSSERSDTNVDLFYITTLKPASIIWGKSVAAVSVTTLFFSSALPFMTLTYLLRGLDVPSMLVLLALDFLIVIAAIQFGIFLGCLPGGLMSRIIRGLIGLGVLGMTFQVSLVASLGLLFSGVGSSIGTWEFWRAALSTGALMLLGIGMIFALSVTIITPKSANRALGMRIYLLIVWLVTAVIAVLWSFAIHDDWPVLTWMIANTLLFCISLFVCISERLEWGARIIRCIPRNPVLRFFAFPFFSGASAGIVYAVIFIAATILLAFLCMDFGSFKLNTDALHSFMFATSTGLYAFCYALTALAIRRLFFRISTRPDITGIIVTLLIIAGTVIPVVIGFLSRSNSLERLSPKWFIGNPFVIIWYEDMWSECLTFTGIWAICVLAVTMPWLINQFRSFRPVLINKSGGTQVQNNE